MALVSTASLSAYHAAFTVGLNDPSIKKEQLHRDTLPFEPRAWKQMIKHRFSMNSGRQRRGRYESERREGPMRSF